MPDDASSKGSDDHPNRNIATRNTQQPSGNDYPRYRALSVMRHYLLNTIRISPQRSHIKFFRKGLASIVLNLTCADYWVSIRRQLSVFTGAARKYGFDSPTLDKRGGLKGSMQHWPVVYSPEFQSPTSCVGAD